MVENDTPGWYGNFSFVGRSSAATFNLKKPHDKKQPKSTLKSTQEDTSLLYDDTDDDFKQIDIFNPNFKPELLDKPKPCAIQRIINASMLTTPEDRYKFYQQHMKALKPRTHLENPACTKYNPKMNIIWSKPQSGPLWKKLQGRTKKQVVDDRKYVDIDHYNIEKLPKKGFIDLDKQTMRGGSLLGNLRMRNEKKYIPLKRNKSECTSFDNKHITMRKKIIISNNVNRIESKEHIDIPNMLLRNPLTFGIISKRITSRNESETKRLYNSNNNNNNNKHKLRSIIHSKKNNTVDSKCLLVPDFKKSLSRSDMDKGKAIPKSNVAIISPNVDLVKSRPIMMVAYNRSKSLKKINPKFEGIDNSLCCNLDKVYDKYNNHKPVSVPLFRSMTSRPNIIGSPLPSFMQQMFTRAGASCVTDKTLKMNNYSKGKFIKDYSSFIQKKSFNQMINMSLLNKSNVYNEHDMIDNSNSNNNNNMSSDMKDIQKHFANSIEFYNKNYDELVHEYQFRKIDNITYKTEKRNNRYMLSEQDLKRFVIDFGEVDKQLHEE
jgi:hypothetical protein